MQQEEFFKEKIIAEALLSQFIILMVQFVALRVFNIKGTSREYLVIIPCMLIVGLFFLRAFKLVFSRSGKLMILAYLLCGISFCIQLLIFPGNTQVMSSIFSVCLIGIPSYIYSYSINNYDVVLLVFKKSSKILLIIGMPVLYLILFRDLTDGSYAMGYSYYLLIPCLFYTHDFFASKKTRSLLLMFVCVFSIIISGSRGPILSWITLVILEMLARLPLTNAITIATIGGVVLTFRTKIFLFLFNLFNRLGIYSRTLILFSQPNITLSNRDIIYKRAVNLIADNWVIGVGIAGDKRYLGMYPHNLFLEVIVHFGTVIGGVISLYLLYLIIKFIGIAFKEQAHRFFFVIFCLGVVPLMFSSSYIGNAWFWIF